MKHPNAPSLFSLFRLGLFIKVLVGLNLFAAPMTFDESRFAEIKFLEGRWTGVGPDGQSFFEEYVLVDPKLLRSIRHADATFSKEIDASTVTFKDGVITSTWGEYTWRATSLSSTKACFEPVKAPSSFCWERVSSDRLTVTQRWLDAEGKEQSFVLSLTRVR